ncbi:MAG: cobalamin biosynthesis protein [Desulfovibrio sp.]|nr:cobalamin biosynthesis protein [Desulfovibrio sp.]
MHPVFEKNSLACYALSASALPLARRLKSLVAGKPWTSPRGVRLADCRICMPERICPSDAQPFHRLGEFLSTAYGQYGAHVFIGAAGIAVRALAPLLTHKSMDPPVLVLDTAGKHVISLLSGHWGGGNELTRHVAQLLRATPVITTASDVMAENDAALTEGEEGDATGAAGRAEIPCTGGHPLALDLFLREAGLRIVDWQRLPRAQAALLEGEGLAVWDPCGAMPGHAFLKPVPCAAEATVPPHLLLAGKREAHAPPLLAAHWRRLPLAEGLLRVAVPRLYVGLGCRKDLPPGMALAALHDFFAIHGLEPQAIAALSTVTEKLQERALRELAFRLDVPLQGFDSARLALCPVPNPSEAAGRRFGQPPFSVCEAAALLAARGEDGAGMSRLLLPKEIFQSQLTIAVALAFEEDHSDVQANADRGEEG